jgi:hypothetical protein
MLVPFFNHKEGDMGTDIGHCVMWNSIEGMGKIAFQNEPD